MSDAERRSNAVYLAAGTSTTFHAYYPEESLLTDVGFVPTGALAPNATPPFTITVSAKDAAGTVTSLVTFGSLAAVGTLVAGSTYVITSLGTTTQADWNTAATTSGVTYAAGSYFTAKTGGHTLTGTGAAIIVTRPTASTVFGYTGYVAHAPGFGVSGLNSSTGATQAAVACSISLASRYFATDPANPTAVAYGALPANAPYGGNVISKVKGEFAAAGEGLGNRSGIIIPAGSTISITAAFAVSAAATVVWNTRPGRG